MVNKVDLSVEKNKKNCSESMFLPIGVQNKIKRDEAEFLYQFDADLQTVGVLPSDIVIEAGLDSYEIADVGGVIGKVLRKKTADASVTWCYFNSYNVFSVPVVGRFHFYINNISSYQFAFGVNMIDASSG